MATISSPRSRRFLVAGLAVIVGFLVGEFLVRTVAPQRALVGDDFYLPDTELGWRLAPGRDGTMSDQVEFRVRVRTDQHGLRTGAESPSNGPALLGLGDSMLFGWGVEEEESFLALTADQLALSPANAAVPAYGPCQAVKLGERLLGELAPRAIVLGIFLGNDELDAGRGRESFEVHDGVLQPHGWRPSRLRPLLHPLFDHSHLVRLVRYSPPFSRWSNAEGAAADPRAVLSDVLAAELKVPPREIEAGDAAIAACLPSLRDRASELGAPLLAVLIPELSEVDPGVLQHDATLVGTNALDPVLPARRMTKVLDGAGIRSFDLSEAFRAAQARGESLYFRGDRHLNARGHRVAEEALAGPIAALLRTSSPPPSADAGATTLLASAPSPGSR